MKRHSLLGILYKSTQENLRTTIIKFHDVKFHVTHLMQVYSTPWSDNINNKYKNKNNNNNNNNIIIIIINNNINNDKLIWTKMCHSLEQVTTCIIMKKCFNNLTAVCETNEHNSLQQRANSS